MRATDRVQPMHNAESRRNAYLTDEVFLYRVVRLVAVGLDPVVELEDCYRLGVVRVPLQDLRRRRLRVVTPAADVSG